MQRLSRLAWRCKSAHLVVVTENGSRKLLGAESKVSSVRLAPNGYFRSPNLDIYLL